MSTTLLRPTKRCPSCGHELTLDYFRQKQPRCDVCVDVARSARPWTSNDTSLLRDAAKSACGYFTDHWQTMTELERNLFRDLINAVDRRRGWESD